MRSRHEARCMWRSIVNSLRVPAISVNVVVNAIQRVVDFDIPLFAIPHIGPPPVTRCVPWPAGDSDRAVRAMKSNPGGNGIAELNGRVQHRTEQSKGERNIQSRMQA